MLRKPLSISRILASEPEQLGSESLDDAKFVIQDVGNWIKNADTKSTVIAAATGVVATAVASKIDIVYSALNNTDFHCKWALLVLAALSFVALVATGYYLNRALSPRTHQEGAVNRFAWPSLANGKGVPREFSWSAANREAWDQAERLAGIAKLKFENLRTAMRWFGLGFVSSLVMIIVATWNSKP